MPDPFTDARFVEQIAAEFPDQPVELTPGVTFTRHSTSPPQLVADLWLAQGRPRHRGVIVQVGQCWLDGVGWHVSGWQLDGTFCPEMVVVEYETHGGVVVVRSFGGWHLPDLWRAAQAPSPWHVNVGTIW